MTHKTATVCCSCDGSSLLNVVPAVWNRVKLLYGNFSILVEGIKIFIFMVFQNTHSELL
jgi:hypothetical protein